MKQNVYKILNHLKPDPNLYKIIELVLSLTNW